MDMDVYSGGKEKMSLADVWFFLRENVAREAELYFGLKDPRWIERVTNNWFDDKNNYDGRWTIIRERFPAIGRVLDMAAGCGTFVLYGLQNGYDVWGVEPEEWKREYFRRKVLASNYPKKFLNHIIAGVGEKLPFGNESFNLVTTYQTLEHVKGVKKCIHEMLRVLKPEGILYIRAPDYNCFFEPHYRVPFLPKMNKNLALIYLKLISRPTSGLQTLQWTTNREVTEFLKMSGYNLKIDQTGLYYSINRQKKIGKLLPIFLRNTYIIRFLNFVYELRFKMSRLAMVGRQENNIDLWVTKIA